MSGARRSSRWWIAVQVAPLLLSVGAWLALQGVLRRDCVVKQAGYGFVGCIVAPEHEPWLDWRHGTRRDLLRAAVAQRGWLWPLALAQEVRGGAAQLLVESARGDDATAVAEAVERQQLDPAFGALHFALAWSESRRGMPEFLAAWLDGAPHQQLFAAVTLSMLTGTRAQRLDRVNYSPLPAPEPAARAAELERTAQALFLQPLADAAAAWREEVAAATQRSRAEIVALLAICPRRWSLF